MAIDERLVGALHLQSMSAADLDRERRSPHETFQTSTIATLLDGAYDGDVTFAELAERGDFGLGTLDGCDGEMIAIDGSFLRADVEGRLHPVPPEARTPFAVVTRFRPVHTVELAGPLSDEEVRRAIDAAVGHGERVHAIRIEGSFAAVRARSVPRQHPPYRPLAEVIGEQHVFELGALEGTAAGFRFPDAAGGLNVPGYHLHFASADRSRGGHLLGFRLAKGTAQVDDSVDVHLELPAGVELPAGGAAAADLRRVELEG